MSRLIPVHRRLVNNMPETFQFERRVEFRDTDAAGIVHFSNFFGYMEEAEHELLRHVGLSVHSRVNDKTVSWPRVAAKCDYRKSIKFEQIITINVTIDRIGTKSITWHFDFQNEQNESVAEGVVTTVCCEIPPKGGLHESPKPNPIAIPDSFVTKLKAYEKEA